MVTENSSLTAKWQAMINKLIKLDSESPKHICVIGDVMQDVYVYGHQEECQEGCSKFVRDCHVKVPGGAANAARSLAHWNVKRTLLPENPFGPVKTRFMVDDKCVYRYDDDRYGFGLDLARTESLSKLSAEWFDAVLISDYDKGFLTPEFIHSIITLCNARNIVCVADVKRYPELYHGAIIKGNWEWSVKHAQQEHVITCGIDPPFVNGHSIKISLPPVPCVNHVGAGDCFAGHLTLALAYGISLKDSAAIAHSAGRVYVQHRHNYPPTPELIREDMLSV